MFFLSITPTGSATERALNIDLFSKSHKSNTTLTMGRYGGTGLDLNGKELDHGISDYVSEVSGRRSQ